MSISPKKIYKDGKFYEVVYLGTHVEMVYSWDCCMDCFFYGDEMDECLCMINDKKLKKTNICNATDAKYSNETGHMFSDGASFILKEPTI
jgi:hypothetical protein